MRLLTVGLHKTICLVCGLVLVLAWGVSAAQDGGSDGLGVPRKRNVDPASRNKANGEDTKPQDNVEDEAGISDADETDDVEKLPDIRRRPPRTDEDEQRYKRYKFQTDPFLTVWDFAGNKNAYNPMDFLTGTSEMGYGRYMALAPNGEVVGSLSIDVEAVSDNEHGAMIRITMRKRLEHWWDTVVHLERETFRPIRLEEWNLGLASDNTGNGDGNSGAIVDLSVPRFLAKYRFDRVDIEHEHGDMISRARFRQLPYSFDRTSFVLVARQINFRFPNWPFQAPLTDPVMGAKIILSIPKPERVEVLSAEPKTYNCYELKLQLGGLEETWWIERVPPNRLIKFTQNNITYTLSQYLEHK